MDALREATVRRSAHCPACADLWVLRAKLYEVEEKRQAAWFSLEPLEPLEGLGDLIDYVNKQLAMHLTPLCTACRLALGRCRYDDPRHSECPLSQREEVPSDSESHEKLHVR